MTKGQQVRDAVVEIESAMSRLRIAESALFYARNDQRTRLGMALMDLAEIYDILTDPECTPEILDREEAE